MNASRTMQYYFISVAKIRGNILGNESVMNQNILLKRNKNILSIVLFETFAAFLYN